MEFSRTKHQAHYILMRYLEDIKEQKGFRSMYAMLKASSMQVNYHSAVRRFVDGKNRYAKYIQIDMFVRLYLLHGVLFDLGRYVKEYEDKYPSSK